MEEMGHLFDACDKSHVGDVPVSTLIEAFKREIHLPDKHGNGRGAEEELLMDVRHLLDPLGNDIAVDKATWIAAWQTQAESPKHKRTRDMAGGDVLSPTDVFTDGQGEGFLDVSKSSYCFSPGSRSSSVESEPEEVIALKQENQRLQNCIRTLKERWQIQEDALAQEQMEKHEQEKIFKEEINRLTRLIKILHETEKDLKCTLETCEREKLELCHTVTRQSELDRQQKLKITVQLNEIASLNAEIEELNAVKDWCKQEMADLQAGLEQQATAHREQIKEYQDAIGTLTAEKNEMNLKISHSLLNKRDVCARLDETQFSSLQSEIGEVEEDCTSTDLISENVNDTSLKKTQLAAPQNVLVSSTPSTFHLSKIGNSLRDEMQAAGSFLNSTAELDCSFDVVQESPIHLSHDCDKSNSLNRFNSASNQQNSDARQVILQKCHCDQDDRRTEIIDKEGEAVTNYSLDVPTFQQTNKTKQEFEHINEPKYEKETQTEVSHQEIRQGLVLRRNVAVQTDCHLVKVLREERNEFTQTVIHKHEIETQTEFSHQEIRQDLIPRQDADVQTDSNDVHQFQVPRDLRNESTQTEIHDKCEIETQTEVSSQEIRQYVIQKQDVDVQTDIPVKILKTRHTQTRIHKRGSKGELELKTFTERCKFNTSIKAARNGIETKTENEEPSSSSNISQLNKHVVLDNGCKQNDLLQHSSGLHLEKELVHSTLTEGRVGTTYFKPVHFLSRCGRVVACLSLFFFLVMASTILFTAAILEQATESGVLSAPYYGSVPSWIKMIVGPFIQLETQQTRYIPV